MTTPSAGADAAYSLEQAEEDIANLRGQMTNLAEYISTGQIVLSGSTLNGYILSITDTTSGDVSSALELIAAGVGDRAIGAEVAGDTANRFRLGSDGSILWGPGNATQDTALNRNSIARLGQQDAGGNVTITPASRIATIANSTAGATATIATITLPSVDIIANAIYRLTVYGQATWGTTQESLTFTGAIAGTSLGANTIAAAAFPVSASLRFKAEVIFNCLTAGSGGTGIGAVNGSISNTGTNLGAFTAASNSLPFVAAGSSVSVNTTISNTLTLAVSWGATGFGSAVTPSFGFLERIG